MENGLVVAKAKRANATEVVDPEQVVELSQKSRGICAWLLALPGMVALDDFAAPAVRRRIGEAVEKCRLVGILVGTVLVSGPERQVGG